MTKTLSIPSRHSNPFATCWTRPGALAFEPTSSADPTILMSRLASTSWRGQILGPHGSGKTTLLRGMHSTLAPLAVRCVWLRADREALLLEPNQPTPAVCFVDSFETLSRWRRRQWRRRAVRLGWGLIVTAHTDVGLPTLATLNPTLQDVLCCFRSLTRSRPTPITPDDVCQAHARCGGNVREIWFDLYDRHERQTRGANHSRTATY